jgi:hypothetical protein
MVRVSYLGDNELPARPDPTTGRPWPPRAPAYAGTDTPADRDPHRERGRTPSPPPGQSPVLAWYRASRRAATMAAAWMFALVAVAFTVGLGFDWVSTWVMWPIIAVGLLGVYSSVRVSQCRAGADWLARRRTWVKTYELVKVTCHSGVGDAELRFEDTAGRRTEIKISDLQSDRDIWDLTYNGILHSVIAGGARTNGLLHVTLQLPYPRADAARLPGETRPGEHDDTGGRASGEPG